MKTEKATILQVGYVDENDQPQKFIFDCRNVIPGITIQDEEILYGGWSVDELRKISIN